MKKTKAYVQFSKRIVVLVTVAVTIACYAASVFCFIRQDMPSLVAVIKAYIQYATFVFIAYSGNSALEKWIINRSRIQPSTTTTTTPDEEDVSSVG